MNKKPTWPKQKIITTKKHRNNNKKTKSKCMIKYKSVHTFAGNHKARSSRHGWFNFRMNEAKMFLCEEFREMSIEMGHQRIQPLIHLYITVH